MSEDRIGFCPVCQDYTVREHIEVGMASRRDGSSVFIFKYHGECRECLWTLKRSQPDETIADPPSPAYVKDIQARA